LLRLCTQTQTCGAGGGCHGWTFPKLSLPQTNRINPLHCPTQHERLPRVNSIALKPSSCSSALQPAASCRRLA
jgi:hypothetical protein